MTVDRRSLLNLALVPVVLGLGALIWFKPGIKDPDADQPLAFPGIAAATRLVVLGADGNGATTTTPRWTLEKRADGWWLTAPFTVAADQSLVEDTLKSLAEAQSRARYTIGEIEPKALGLAPPGTVLLVGAAGHEVRYEFGGTDPIDYRRYLRAGDTVHLIDDLTAWHLMQEAGALASKRLLPVGAKVVKLELPGRTFSRDTGGKWSVMPDDPSLSADALVGIVESWQDASATTVRGRSDGVVQAMVRVTLEGATAPLEFELLTAVDGLRFARADLKLEYELPNSARARLLSPPAAPAKP